MSVRTDVINLMVNVNGNQSQNQLNDLRKRAAELTLEMQNLKKGTQAYIDKNNELRQVNTQMADLKKQIGITSLTQKELNQELARLNAMKGSIVPFTKEFFDLQEQINAVKNRLEGVRAGMNGFQLFFSKITDEVKQFGMIAGAYLGFEFLTKQLHSIISGTASLSDKFAQLKIYMHGTDQDVQALVKSLRQIDTRTSMSDLLDISTIVAKKGVAKQEIAGVTKALDELFVVLGDEVGDKHEAIASLVKLVNVYSEDHHVTADNIGNIGAAIQKLTSSGVATGNFLISFAERMAGVRGVTGITIQNVLGLGAALEELGQKSESAGTASQKLLIQMFLKPAEYAKAAGMSIQDFSALLAKSPVEALIKVAGVLKQTASAPADLIKEFQGLEISGARVFGVLGDIAGNADYMRKRVNDAGKAFGDQGSLLDAFNIKNQTFGATLDKLGKDVNSLVYSSGLTNFLKSAVVGLSDFVKWLKDLPNWLERNRTMLIALSTIVLVYVAAQTKAAQATLWAKTVALAKAAADRAVAIWQGIATAATTAYSVAMDLLSGKIKLATVATQIWNFLLKQNPLVWIVTIVGAAATAISFLTDKTRELTAAQKLQNEIHKVVVEKTSEEMLKVRMLSSVVGDHTVALDNRKKALQQLISIAPTYLNGLTLENIATAQGKKLLDDYLVSLTKKAELEAKSDALKEKLVERDKAFSQLRSADPSGYGKMNDSQLEAAINRNAKSLDKSGGTTLFGGEFKEFGVETRPLAQAIEQIKSLESDLTAAAKKNVTDVLGGASTMAQGATKVTIQALKDQLQALEDAYVQIDITDKKGLAANAAARKKLQDQINDLEGKQSPEAKKEESQYERLLKQAQGFYAEVDKLKRDINIRDEDANKKALDAIREKYADLIAKVVAYNAEVAKSSLSKVQKQNLTGKGNDEIAQLAQLQKKEVAEYLHNEALKQFAADSKKEYDEAKLYLKQYFDDQQKQTAQDYAAGLMDKEDYEAKKQAIEQRYTAARIVLAKDYAKAVEQAGKDVVSETEKQEEQMTANLAKQTEAREKFAELEADARAKLAELGMNKNSPAGKKIYSDQLAKDAFDKTTALLKKSLVQQGKDSSDAAVQETQQYKAAWATMQQQLAQNNADYWQNEISNVSKYVQAFESAMTSIDKVFTASENRRLALEQQAATKKTKALNLELQGKLISQNRYNTQTTKLQQQQDIEQSKIQREQAKRQKAISLFAAILNTAQGVTAALTAVPFGPWNFAEAAAVGAAGLAESIAIIEEPLPPIATAARGGMLGGDSHANGGMPVLNTTTGRKEAELEGGEAIINKKAMAAGQQLTVSGTPSQIASAINSTYGGVSWASGATIQMPQWRTAPQPQINSRISRIMAAGGAYGYVATKAAQAAGATGADAADGQVVSLLQTQNQLLAENTQEIKNQKSQLHAVVSVKEFRQQERLFDTAKKVSSLVQQ